MPGMDEAVFQCLLEKLDTAGAIFPEFELYKVNGQPQLLGKGGYARVYEMRSKNGTDTKYALKVIGMEKHAVTSERFWETVYLQRFLAEQSPHVARIIDAKAIVAELSEAGELLKYEAATEECWQRQGYILQFLLMEKYEEVLKRDRFGKAFLAQKDLEEEKGVLSFAMQIGQALYLAHQNNILHRDIKLENIFWDEKEKIYRLGDFGIARYVENGNAETVVYTDGYGAPEIERHLGKNYDATADIYSFGITLYLLLNELKFPGSSGYYVNLVQYHPDFVFPAPVNASESMTRVLRKMCSYDKADRYQTIAEVLTDLNFVVEQQETGMREMLPNMPDLPTETFHEEKAEIKEKSEQVDGGRAKRIREENICRELYNEDCWKFLVGFTLLFVPLFCGLQPKETFGMDSQLWVLPILGAVEAILLRKKEFYLLFGAVLLGIIGYSATKLGLTVVHIMLAVGVVSGIWVLLAGAAVGAGIWMIWVWSGKMLWLDGLAKYDIGWIFIFLLSLITAKFIGCRLTWGQVSSTRANLEMWIWEKFYLVVAMAGIVLWGLQRIEVAALAVSMERLHLIRVGIISMVIMRIYRKWNNYLEAEDELLSDERNQG